MKPCLVLVVAMTLAIGSVAASERSQVRALPEKWRVWLEEQVYPLITSEQRKTFLALETEPEREAFAERLWAIWAEGSGIGPAFRRNYEERLERAKAEYGNTTEDRARVLLLHGQPDGTRKLDCEVFQPIEIWIYARMEGIGERIVLLFYKPYGLGRYRLWDPFETRLVLYTVSGQEALKRPMMYVGERPEWRCGDANEILALISTAELWLKDLKLRSVLDHAPATVTGAEESASTRFLRFSTILGKDAQPLSFSVNAVPGARRGSKVRVAINATAPREGLGTTKVGDADVIQLDVTGEIATESAMIDRFKYAFTFPAAAAELPLTVERDLRPGRYKLRVKVADANSKREGVQDLEFEVPVPAVPTETAAERQAVEAVTKLAGSADAALALQGPEGEGVTGVQRFTALAAPAVSRVEFFLDSRSVLTKNRPPFEVELDLGPFPRLATITAVAFDASGQEIDRKQLSVNVGRERFLVRLQPIGAGDRVGGKVRAQATVNVPPSHKLEKVELFWNETRVATLFQSPYDVWLPIEDSGEIGYLRALATLDDGAQAEDVEFVNAPQFLAGVKVETVELPVTVIGAGGKPLEGLTKTDFVVLEDGAPQTISHFSLQQNLPIHLALVLDTSGSMQKTLSEVQRVVLGFLKEFLRPRDRACVVAFSDKPALVEGFTADFGALERALLTLRADRETALFDATVYGLFQFSGVRGRKAMIILTDGEDNVSRIDFERTLDYARRSGVTIYTIGLDLPITKVKARSFLNRLARSAGGESFFLARDAALQPVYEQIDRELRSQYLLAYTSTSERPSDVFRKIVVNVDRPGVEVRTLAGYYPGD